MKKHPTDELKIMVKCDMCDREFQRGPHIYTGTPIERFKLLVCETCYGGNWDGWSPTHEQRFLDHLKKNNISIPERNAKGWFPRGD